MNEKTKKILRILISVIIFAISIGLLVSGQQRIGPGGLMMMMVGLAGLILLLYRYNRNYR